MAKFGGFYKGEKKKKKKDGEKAVNFSSAPEYVMPEIISKKKKEEPR